MNPKTLNEPKSGNDKHEPHSTLLMMVCAFGGYKNVMNAYEVAMKEGYKIGPYGDAMLII